MLGSTLHVCRPALAAPLWALTAGLFLCVSAGLVRAEAALSERHAKLVTQLDAESFAQRQQATRALMTGAWLNDATLRAMFEAGTSPEQRHRLIAIARHQTLRRSHARFDADNPRQQGAVGIIHQAQPKPDRPGAEQAVVIVLGTVPGFPGYAYLEPGDQILAINGQSFPDNVDRTNLPQRIVQFAAGETIRLTVKRRGQQRRVRFELASKAALDASRQQRADGQGTELSDAYLQPWRARRKQLPRIDPNAKTISLGDS
jgi:hypothetical protein